MSDEGVLCGQCGKPAMMMVGSFPLCVEHYAMFQQAQAVQQQQAAAMINYLEREMASIAGLPHLAQQIQIMPLPSGNQTHNNIQITSSTIGAINTGLARDIAVHLNQLHQAGHETVRSSLQAFTEAVTGDGDLGDAAKKEMLEQIAQLSAEAATPDAQRKTGVVKAILATLRDGATAVTGLASAWTALEPILKAHFGL